VRDETFTPGDLRAVATGRIFRERLRKPFLYLCAPWLLISMVCMMVLTWGAEAPYSPATWAVVLLTFGGALLWLGWGLVIERRHLRSGEYDMDAIEWDDRDLRNVVGHRMGNHWNRYMWRLAFPWLIVATASVYGVLWFGYLYPWELQVVGKLLMIGLALLVLFGVWMHYRMNRREQEEVRALYDARRSASDQIEPGAWTTPPPGA